MKKIKYNTWPSYSVEELEIISHILSSNKVNYWTGDEGKAFEDEYAQWCGTNYAIALANGTVALELALKSLGVGQGDEVITSPRTFIGTASAIVAVGAEPVFADVEIDNQNISADTISEVITPLTKAIIVVHLAGLPAEMDEINSVAQSHGLFVIEDCAQAHGARYKDKSVGSLGDIGCWSFCQDKIITTAGEGGMVTTNSKELYERIWSLKDHGKNRNKIDQPNAGHRFRWLHDNFGSNLRMTEIQAGIGRYQLTKVEEWCKIRRLYMSMYDEIIEKFTFLAKVTCPSYCVHAGYRYYFFIENDFAIAKRDELLEFLNDEGIPSFQGTCSEIYLEKAFDKINRNYPRLHNAKHLGESSIALLVHPSMTITQVKEICSALEKVLYSFLETYFSELNL